MASAGEYAAPSHPDSDVLAVQAELQQHRTSTSDRSLRIVQLDTELAAKEAAVQVCVPAQEVLCFEHSPQPEQLMNATMQSLALGLEGC